MVTAITEGLSLIITPEVTAAASLWCDLLHREGTTESTWTNIEIPRYIQSVKGRSQACSFTFTIHGLASLPTSHIPEPHRQWRWLCKCSFTPGKSGSLAGLDPGSAFTQEEEIMCLGVSTSSAKEEGQVR